MIDQELGTGSYDLVNYEWSIMRMFPFRKVPSVLAVHELAYTAYLSHLREIETTRPLEVAELGELLRLFWFNVVDLPKALMRSLRLRPRTRKASGCFARQPGVFEAATEVRKKKRTRGSPSAHKRDELNPEEPRFLYLANFRHPPNLKAAEFLIKEVMPRVQEQIPRARLELVGPHAPAN